MTRAVTIAELGDQNTFVVDGTNQRVGIASANPTVTLDVGGVVVATAFTGDGSGLTSLNVGAGGTWNSYDSNTGITTTKKVKIENDLEVTGIVTARGGFEIGASGVGGTITSVGNAEFVGFVTAKSGLRIPGGTFSNTRLELGNSQEFSFQYNTASTKGIVRVSSQDLEIEAKTVGLYPNNGENGVIANQNGSVDLYHDNVKKLETTAGGVEVTGIVTATSFSGSGENLTDLNIPSGFNELDAALFN